MNNLIMNLMEDGMGNKIKNVNNLKAAKGFKHFAFDHTS